VENVFNMHKNDIRIYNNQHIQKGHKMFDGSNFGNVCSVYISHVFLLVIVMKKFKCTNFAKLCIWFWKIIIVYNLKWLI